MDGGAYEAFNAYMQQFLEALVVTFPEEVGLADIMNRFPVMCSMQPKQPHRLFMKQVMPHYDKVVGHDESVILDGSLDVPGILDVKQLWTAQGVTQDIRETMWKYLDTLVMLGASIQSLPPEMMSQIEGIAASIQKDVEASGETPNMMDIFARVQRETSHLQ